MNFRCFVEPFFLDENGQKKSKTPLELHFPFTLPPHCSVLDAWNINILKKTSLIFKQKRTTVYKVDKILIL